MSDDDTPIIYAAPTSWKVPGFDGDPRYQGSVGGLRRADEETIALLRKRLRLLDVDDLEQRGKVWVDADGTEYKLLVNEFVDLLDPAAAGVTAFAVTLDNHLMFLRPRDWQGTSKRVELGEMSGRRAT